MQLERKVKKRIHKSCHDEDLSDRHRLWGWDCPATDIDFLEYDNGIRTAIFDWKRENAAKHESWEANLCAQRDLADAAGIPFFIARRAHDFSWIYVIPENSRAEEIIKKRFRENAHRFETEIKFVRFLYSLRGREELPQEVIDEITRNPFVPRTKRQATNEAFEQLSLEEQMAFLNEKLLKKAS